MIYPLNSVIFHGNLVVITGFGGDGGRGPSLILPGHQDWRIVFYVFSALDGTPQVFLQMGIPQ
jgi:hypothetical protein